LQVLATRAECAFYFLLTGFFYFVLGLILLMGLPLPKIIHTNKWLFFQPVFGLLLAAQLTVLGLMLYKKGDAAMGYIRVGTVIFAALIILNCWMGTIYIQPVKTFLIMALHSICGLVLAVLLGRAVDRCCSDTISGRVDG